MGNEQGKIQGVPTPAGIQSMDESLQRKFAKGIQYNMKIVIRGDRNTGKSTLFHRMEGKPFVEAYLPTNEIQVTSILWSYRVTNDTVKVEIWDVVDRGRTQKSRGSKGLLKMFNSPEQEEEEEGEGGQTLDANFLDVYKGAHGVVFTFDMTKQWTWKYIERELPQVPLHIPIIILANFMDLSEHRLISKEDCLGLISVLDRPDGAADIRYAECSMKNGFGLMHLHKFLSIPFLQLQQETLLQQLQVNREQTLAALEELDAARGSEDQNYTLYLDKLQRMAEERRQKSRQQLQESGEDGAAAPMRRNTLEGKPSSSATPPRPHKPVAPPTSASTSTSARASDPPPPAVSPSGDGKLQKTNSITSRLSSKFSGFLGKGKELPKSQPEAEAESESKAERKVAATGAIEEFVPEGSMDFLESGGEEEGEGEEDDSDEESNTGNPMIAADEDLSSPEEPPTPPPSPPKSKKSNPTKPPIAHHSSESEEEQSEPAPAILMPTKAPTHREPPRPRAASKPLKSALDIELTESEDEEGEGEESGAAVMGDEDVDLASRKPRSEKRPQNLEDIFEQPRSAKKKAESKGLMLQFAAPSPPMTAKATPLLDTPNEESPDLQRRKEKKKKKSKKRKSSKEDGTAAESPAVAASDVAVGTRNGRTGSVSTANDPYAPLASLDAWLNSDTALDDFLTPTKASDGAGVEEGVEAVGSEERHAKKSAKKHHKHKKRSEDVDGEEGGSHKKRRSHHKSSSRHRSSGQGD